MCHAWGTSDTVFPAWVVDGQSKGPDYDTESQEEQGAVAVFLYTGPHVRLCVCVCVCVCLSVWPFGGLVMRALRHVVGHLSVALAAHQLGSHEVQACPARAGAEADR